MMFVVRNNLVLPAFIMEPSSLDKRRAYGRAIIAPKTPFSPSLEHFRTHVKNIRNAAVADLDSLVMQLSGTLRRLPNIEVVMASDGQQALKAVRLACGTTRTIAINQSSVVKHELSSGLREGGFRLIDSYSGEFSRFEDRFAKYSQLPEAPASQLLASFSASNLADLRAASIDSSGVKDFVGLLGVNAISARNGTVFFMEHFSNISRVFKQARKLILVVAMEKIVADNEEARLQTVAMGIFGWEIRLLGLGNKGGDDRLQDIPLVDSSAADPRVLVIVIDNGRRRLLTGPYRDLLLCIGCRACIRNCPTQQFFGINTGLSPKEYLYYFIQGQNGSLDLCLNCGMCRIECPLDIDVSGMIIEARSQRPHKRPSFGSMLLANFELLSKWGSGMPGVANALLASRSARWFADGVLGISKDAPVPKFGKDTLEGWLKRRGSQ
jgi:L-lactate utilization protein LutB